MQGAYNKPLFAREGQHTGNERNALRIDLNGGSGGALQLVEKVILGPAYPRP